MLVSAGPGAAAPRAAGRAHGADGCSPPAGRRAGGLPPGAAAQTPVPRHAAAPAAPVGPSVGEPSSSRRLQSETPGGRRPARCRTHKAAGGAAELGAARRALEPRSCRSLVCLLPAAAGLLSSRRPAAPTSCPRRGRASWLQPGCAAPVPQAGAGRLGTHGRSPSCRNGNLPWVS